MQISYELSADDLQNVQAQLLSARRERIRKSPVVFGVTVGVAGAMVWPVWRRLTERDGVLLGRGLQLGVYLGALAVATVIVLFLRRKVAPPQFRALSAWSAQRMNRQAIQKSVLGPITVRIDEDGLSRTNSAGELKVPWGEVAAILRSPLLTTVQLKQERRVIILPRRAFADQGAADAFRQRIETLAKVQSVPVEI